MIVVDADVLIGALDASDAHHAKARRFFTECRSRGEEVSISVVNLTEVLVAPAADALTRAVRYCTGICNRKVHQSPGR